MNELTISTGRSRKETEWRIRHITWDKLCEKLSKTVYTEETEAQYQAMTREEKSNVKDVGGFVGGELQGGRRKNASLLNRQILALDVDFATPELWDDYDLLCDWACFAHTTHSHTKENPRYRMFFPMTRAVDRTEYEAIGRKVAQQIGIEFFDDTTYQAARLMFWPSTCKDGEFLCWKFDGDWIDPDQVLSMYTDWQDVSEWPVSSRQTQVIRKHISNKQADPRAKTGIVGAFCQVYDIPDAIAKYLPEVYLPTEDPHRFTYAGGSTHGGLVLYDKDTFAYSWHDTDPASGRECNAFDLVRIHKFPGQDDKQSFESMKGLVSKDPDVRKALETISRQNAESLFQDGGDGDGLRRDSGDHRDLTETGNAIRLKDNYGDLMCYNESLGWCIWNGSIWQTNSKSNATMMVMLMNDRMMDDAITTLQVTEAPPDGTPKTKWPDAYKRAMNYVAWANASRGYNNISHTLSAAQAIMQIEDVNAFDADPWSLNTPAGIVNLQTKEITRHHSGSMCTMITDVSPDWDLPKPRYEAFLNHITGGDKDFQTYLQELAGMCLVGKVYEEGVIMVYGTGGNGKSTLFNTWLDVVGDYGIVIRNELLTGNRQGFEVAGRSQLRGKRMVICSELEESQLMSDATLKQMTSRDEISANVKYHEPVSFTPVHTLILHTNHLPRLQSVDGGTQRRIAIAPFMARVNPEDKISDLAGLLVEEEGPAILAWMIDGAEKFYLNHMILSKPKVVQNATDDYIQSEDKIARFIKEQCIKEEGKEINSANLFREFRNWLQENGLKWYGGTPAFRRDMEARGFPCKHTKKGTVFFGLTLDTFEEGL